jgi:RHS repeat-associated protein
MLEERVGGQARVQYVWSPVYVDAMVLRDRDSDGDGTLDERLWVVQDANFNVTAVVDGSGEVVERYVYDPFGQATVLDAEWNVRSGGSAYDWLYLHQGGRYDVTSDLYHFRFRDYSPTLGRWTSLDPLSYAAGDVNLYRYVGNGPINSLDPTGLEEQDITHLIRGFNDGIGGPFWVRSTDKKIGGLFWIDATIKSDLPRGAHVEGLNILFDKRYVGAWMVLGDKDMDRKLNGGKRVWASLKFYEEFSTTYGKVPKVNLGVWEKDIFDTKYYTNWREGGTLFKDFPGLLVPPGIGPKDTIVLRRSYCIMVIGLSDKDPSKVLSEPLAIFMVQLEIKVTGSSVYVSCFENKSHAKPPTNWAKILGLTPVEKLP